MGRCGRIVLVMAGTLVIAGVGAALGLGNGKAQSEGAEPVIGRNHATTETSVDASMQSVQEIQGRQYAAYYKIDFFPAENQTGCPGALSCCEDAYVLVSDVTNACSGQPGATFYVMVRADEPSNCCDCDHTACIVIDSGTQQVDSVDAEACILLVDDCYVTCSGCIGDLP